MIVSKEEEIIAPGPADPGNGMWDKLSALSFSKKIGNLDELAFPHLCFLHTDPLII